MRLIDADGMRENLLWCKEQSGSYNDDYWDDVIERLDVQPTIIGWTSVKDRLPNDAGKYLVTIKSDFADTKYIVKTAWFLNDLYDNWQFRYEGISEHSPGFYNGDGEGDWIENVAYWMPLPEPPEE